MENAFILIAGGSGLIGKRLYAHLYEKGYNVAVLCRNTKEKNAYHWNPDKGEIDTSILHKVTHLINLSGANIAGARWTDARKKEIIHSRVHTTEFLYQQLHHFTHLQHFISASGVSCYGSDFSSKQYREEEAINTDFLSEVVEKWEKAADLFASNVKVSKVRISPVLDSRGGFISEMKKPILVGLGAILGSGNQWMPWIHQRDLVSLFEFVLKNELEGIYNAVAGNVTNRTLTQLIAKEIHRPLILPAVPAWSAKLIFGEMASLFLDGVQVSNEKIKNAGFEFQYADLEESLHQVLM
jgi:uncharacterized protein (TIGR01777 family)